jgi:hypothetical protein
VQTGDLKHAQIGSENVYLAHKACASDSGPQCVVDLERQVQLPYRSLLLPFLSISFFSMKQKALLMPIKLSTAPIFEFSSARARVCIEEEVSMLEIENA